MINPTRPAAVPIAGRDFHQESADPGSGVGGVGDVAVVH
jgi:hypothetical protein